ncbi:hypothetical protein Hanom_Chr08g00719291 [Helianthus anomalus]
MSNDVELLSKMEFSSGGGRRRRRPRGQRLLCREHPPEISITFVSLFEPNLRSAEPN